MKFFVHHREGRIVATEFATKPSVVRDAIPIEAEPPVFPSTHRVENGQVVGCVTLTGNVGSGKSLVAISGCET